jgi:hypothetical protein
MYSLTWVVNVLTRPCENEMVKKRTARRSLSLRTTFKRTARQGEMQLSVSLRP